MNVGQTGPDVLLDGVGHKDGDRSVGGDGAGRRMGAFDVIAQHNPCPGCRRSSVMYGRKLEVSAHKSVAEFGGAAVPSGVLHWCSGPVQSPSSALRPRRAAPSPLPT